MEVVRDRVRYVNYRVAVAVAAVVAATGVMLPVMAPAAEQPGYRRLVEIESSRTFSEELLVDLVSNDTRLAARAALALGRTEDPRAAGPLRNATGSRDVSVRALAVYGYGLLSGKGGVSSAVVARALHDTNGAVRVAATDAAWRQRVGRVTGSVALQSILLHMLIGERDPIVRARAATALTGWSDAPGAPAIANRLAEAIRGEADGTVRWHEAWALRRGFAVRTPEATVRAGLRDADETVRIQFADLVARRKHPQDVRLLEPLLKDASWRVREQAYESIKVLGGGTRTEHLTAIPDVVATPAPEPENTEPPLPRPSATGPLRKPAAADAILDLPLVPATSALMTGPMPGAHPRVRIGTTKGTVVLRLFPEWAPLTVANFLGLADRGYYDGLAWYRIVPDFVAQTGGHLTGKPDNDVENAGYTIPAEENPLEQRSGIIAMGLDYTAGANPGPKRDSAGVEFYLTLSPQLHLNRDFSVFGEIESGFSTLGRLSESDKITRVERLADR